MDIRILTNEGGGTKIALDVVLDLEGRWKHSLPKHILIKYGETL